MRAGPPSGVLGFIHVPKTAGTSFVAGLEARAVPVLRDYGDGPTSPEVRAALYDHPQESLSRARAKLLRSLIDDAERAPQPLFLTGHFRYRDYPFSELGVPVITFLRDPLERVLSHYSYARRAQRERRPLAEFVRAGRAAANIESKVLEGVELDDLAFIGVTERYAECIALFNRQLGLDIPVLTRNPERRPRWTRIARAGRRGRRRVEAEHLDPETRELILSRNARDVELYRAARELVDARLAEAAIGC